MGFHVYPHGPWIFPRRRLHRASGRVTHGPQELAVATAQVSVDVQVVGGVYIYSGTII
jgi:hypothetical protein